MKEHQRTFNHTFAFQVDNFNLYQFNTIYIYRFCVLCDHDVENSQICFYRDLVLYSSTMVFSIPTILKEPDLRLLSLGVQPIGFHRYCRINSLDCICTSVLLIRYWLEGSAKFG